LKESSALQDVIVTADVTAILLLIVRHKDKRQLAERRSSAGELTLTGPALGLHPTSDHYVGNPFGTGQPNRSTQPVIFPRPALKFCFKTCVAMKFVDDDDHYDK